VSERIRGLYVIVDPAQTRGRDAVDVARQALEGGAAMIQWRDKTATGRAATAARPSATSAAGGALLIVNDHADLAWSPARRRPPGPEDPPRRPCAPSRRDFIVGCPHNAEEARRAQADGASYVAVGALFATTSKAVTRPASPERLREVKGAVSVPVVGIGGINEGNIDQVLAAGADAVAVISAVIAADDVRAAAAGLARRFQP
jgi:thiamine-phosphate pyrophosphorylase